MEVRVHRELHAAIVGAFSVEEFERVLHGMGRNLDDYAARGDVWPSVVWQVIHSASRGGWLGELVIGSLAENPGNEGLREFVMAHGREMLVEPPASGVQKIEQVVNMPEADSHIRELKDLVRQLEIQIRGSAAYGAVGLAESMQRLSEQIGKLASDVTDIKRQQSENNQQIRNLWYTVLGIGIIMVILLATVVLQVFT